MLNYSLSEETLGYVTSPDPANTDKRFLIGGSQNTLIDYQKKTKSRPGYTRLGAANTALTPTKNAWTWNTSTGTHLPQRFYNGLLEVYLTSVDGTDINAWTQVSAAFSTSKILRPASRNGGGIYDTTEKIDIQPMVNGDSNIYEWNGAVAVVSSVTGTTVTKTGSTTFGQNRFYTSRNLTFVCARTGTEYTYTAGADSTTLTGIADTTGLVAGDILIQKIVTQSNAPSSTFTNDICYAFQNQLVVASKTSGLVYISKNTSYYDFTFSTPRVAGEGVLLTLEEPTHGVHSLGKFLLIFSGKSSIFNTEYAQITIGSTLAETVQVKKLFSGINQGALNQECIIPIGNILAYLTNEVTLRVITDPNNVSGLLPKTFSNPIKPDFDAEDWDPDQTYGFWYKNILFISAAAASHTYMLNFVEDADGKLFRFWNPPQILPVGPFSVIDSGAGELLHGHSNVVPESYLLFDGASDGQYAGMDPAEKLPIPATAVFAYDFFKKRAQLKTFDEYWVEGEITPSTTALLLDINYDYAGETQVIEKTIDGSDESILEGPVDFNSLAQQSLAVNPLGGLLNPPSNARKFHLTFEIAKEDFYKINASFSTNDVDKYWAILAHGPNATLSPRRDSSIKQ